MALSQATINEILNEVKLQGGVDPVVASIQSAYTAGKVVEARQRLKDAVEITVSDWSAIDAFLSAGVAAQAIGQVKNQIEAKITARDSTNLDVLLFAFFAASRSYLG